MLSAAICRSGSVQVGFSIYLFLGIGLVAPLILKKIENVLSIVFETDERPVDALAIKSIRSLKTRRHDFLAEIPCRCLTSHYS
mgnify:CR=1 FL=1